MLKLFKEFGMSPMQIPSSWMQELAEMPPTRENMKKFSENMEQNIERPIPYFSKNF
jgi:hypothetical protein